MNNNQQEATHNVHLKKAKRSINFILFVSLFLLLFSVIVGEVNLSLSIQLSIVIGLLLSSSYLFKFPLIAVVFLGLFLVYFLYVWYEVLTLRFDPENDELNSGYNMVFNILLVFRGFITLVLFGGFYYAVKGMIEKDQFEKNHGTLDEDQI